MKTICVRGLQCVRLSYPSNPRSFHATYTFLWLMCSLLCLLSTVLIVISCSAVIIRCGENGGTTGVDFLELFENSVSHMWATLPSGFHTADSLHVCWLMCLCGTLWDLICFFLWGCQKCTQFSQGKAWFLLPQMFWVCVPRLILFRLTCTRVMMILTSVILILLSNLIICSLSDRPWPKIRPIPVQS